MRAAVKARTAWPAYAAAAWAAAFAVRGVYWALGGTLGLGTLTPEIQELAAARDPLLLGALWGVVALLLAGVALALALARPWDQPLPSRLPLLGGRRPPAALLLIPAAGAGALLLVHGMSYAALLFTGDLSEATTWWYALLWGPWFITGGALYLLAAHGFRRRVSPGAAGRWLYCCGAVGGGLVGAGPLLARWLVVALG